MENPADIIYISFQISLGEDGKRRALTRLWKVYGKGLYFFISKNFPGNNSHCDDCFQETMLKVFLALDKYSYGNNLKPWIYAIAKNCCIDYLRRNMDNIYELNTDFSHAVEYSSPEESCINNDLYFAIETSLNGFDIDDSRIAFLRFYENMKYREIAKVMNMNENTVKTRISLMKKKLRIELKEWL